MLPISPADAPAIGSRLSPSSRQTAPEGRVVCQALFMNSRSDETEEIRRSRLAVIHSAVDSKDPTTERQRLEAQYGRVWDTAQLSEEFEVLGFIAPYVVVRRRSDGRKGSLEFQHHPRFYFNFAAD
jgi:hypothetical protein